MLPDFPEVKRYAERELFRFIRRQVPALAPVLGMASRFTLHEGVRGRVDGEDVAPGVLAMEPFSAGITLSREEMRTFDAAALHEKLLAMATELARAQERKMLTAVSEAAESVGNTVAASEVTPDHLLEAIRKVEMDFDPETLEPSGFAWVFPRPVMEKIRPQLEAWNSDPDLKRRHEEVLEKKRAEWRDREARRTLVD